MQDFNKKTQNASILTNDIHSYMEEKLNTKDKAKMSFTERKKFVEESLIEYLLLKLEGVDYEKRKKEIYDLVRTLYLENNIAVSDFSVDNITLYLIGTISKIQDYAFEWYIEENDAFIKKPFIDRKEGKVYRFVSHKNTPPLASFTAIWNYFSKELKEENRNEEKRLQRSRKKKRK